MIVEFWSCITFGFAFFTLLIMIPVYWYNYGVQNFLWLCDCGMIFTLIALLSHNTLTMSFIAVLGFMGELVWNIDFFAQLLWQHKGFNLATYMFDRQWSLPLRSLSLFHVFLPFIWIFYLHEFGYDPEAVYYAIPFYWINIITVYKFTSIQENINWVFLPQLNHWRMKPIIWLLLLAVAYPLVVIIPTHFVFKVIF